MHGGPDIQWQCPEFSTQTRQPSPEQVRQVMHETHLQWDSHCMMFHLFAVRRERPRLYFSFPVCRQVGQVHTKWGRAFLSVLNGAISVPVRRKEPAGGASVTTLQKLHLQHYGQSNTFTAGDPRINTAILRHNIHKSSQQEPGWRLQTGKEKRTSKHFPHNTKLLRGQKVVGKKFAFGRKVGGQCVSTHRVVNQSKSSRLSSFSGKPAREFQNLICGIQLTTTKRFFVHFCRQGLACEGTWEAAGPEANVEN